MMAYRYQQSAIGRNEKHQRYFLTIKNPVTLNNLCKLVNALLNFSGKTFYSAILYLKLVNVLLAMIKFQPWFQQLESHMIRHCSIVATSDVWRVVYCCNCAILLKFIKQKQSLSPCWFDHVIFFKIRYTGNDSNTISKQQ